MLVVCVRFVFPGAVKAAPAPAVEGSEKQAGNPTTEDLEKLTEDLEKFSGLPIVDRTVPAETWAAEVQKPSRRYVSFSHIPLYLGSARAMRAKENIIIGVLYYNSGKDMHRLCNGEQYLRWRLTDLSQQGRQIVLQLRWGAYLHWRNGKPAAMAGRGAVLAILNPVPLLFISHLAEGSFAYHALKERT